MTLKFIFEGMLGLFHEMEMLKGRDKLEAGNRVQKIHWKGTARPRVIKPQLFAACCLFSISFFTYSYMKIYLVSIAGFSEEHNDV